MLQVLKSIFASTCRACSFRLMLSCARTMLDLPALRKESCAAVRRSLEIVSRELNVTENLP